MCTRRERFSLSLFLSRFCAHARTCFFLNFSSTTTLLCFPSLVGLARVCTNRRDEFCFCEFTLGRSVNSKNDKISVPARETTYVLKKTKRREAEASYKFTHTKHKKMSAITFQPLAMAKAPSARRSARKSSFQRGAKISPVMKKVRSFPARVNFFFDLFEFETRARGK